MAERPSLKDPARAYADTVDGLGAELEELRRILAAIAGTARTGGTGPTIGVLDLTGADSDRPASAAAGALRLAAVTTELRRRLLGFDVRSYTFASAPTASELAEDAVQSLLPWSLERAAELRAEVDAVVVLSGPQPDDAGGGALADLEQAGMPIHRLTADPEQPDPLVLAGRLADVTLLERRGEYLALTGAAPADSPYVLCLPAESAGAALDERVAPRRRVVRPEGPVVPVDLMALIHGADAVVTLSPEIRAVALGLRRPVVPGVADLDSTGAPPCDPAKESERLASLVSLADRMFDRLYLSLLEEAGTRLASTAVERLAALERRVATLEAVNAGLRQTLARERSVMATEVRRRAEGGPSGQNPSWSDFHVDRMSRDLAAAQVHLARLQGEIDALYATRTMRALAPVRRIYAIARRIIPRSS